MPNPQKSETKDKYIKRFMSSEEAKRNFPDEKQRLAVAYSKWREHSKKSKKEKSCYVHGIEFKESELPGRKIGGFIATTHLDEGFYDEENEVYIRDQISKDTLYKWAEEINQGIPRANKISINHDRGDKTVAGVGVKGSAEVLELNDGKYGLYVDSFVDGTHPDYQVTDNRIDIGTLDSYSIEYLANNPDYIDSNEGYITRILGTDTELHGWTLASRPMNENCVMIKEITKQEKIDANKINTKMEDCKMEEKVETKEVPVFSKEDQELLKEAKEMKKVKEMKETMVELLQDKEFQSKIMNLDSAKKPLANKEEEDVPVEGEEDKGEEKVEETPEQVEEKEMSMQFKELLTNKELDVETKFKEAGLLAEKKGLIWVEGSDRLGFKTSKPSVAGKTEFKTFRANGSKLEFKGLGITTNQNTDTDYLLSAAELKDMFDPFIYDLINESTTTWALLRKDDFSNKGNNQVQFVGEIGANGTAAFYTGNSVATSYSSLLKFQTKFKKVQVGIAVDGDMIASARGGPVGDVFGLHVRLGTKNMLTVVNSALFAEAGLETAAACIGFEYICDSAGNTSLYNLTRSTTNRLAPDSATDTYINGSSARISLDNLRKAIEQATKEGADMGNLVFITHPTQLRLFKSKYDSAQRFPGVGQSQRPGFVGRMEFDGVPIFDDKDCNSDDWFLVDLESHRIAIWVPPTLEMLGKRSDAEEGFVKMYFATYNTVPRRMVMIYGNATS